MWRTRPVTYAGQPGHAVLLVVVVANTHKTPPTVEACEAEVAKLRKEAAAEPEDIRRKWNLAWVIEYQRTLRKWDLPTRSSFFPVGYPTEETLRLAPADCPAEETVQLVREVCRQVPGNVFYRAELRRLLFRQGWFIRDHNDIRPPPGRHPDFPGLFHEILSLVPLDNSEHLEAARLLLWWKYTVLEKDSPEDTKTQLFQEADAKIVQLLRRHAEAWQKHPEEVQKTLQAYEKDAKGQSYAETPQFRELLAQMRDWAKNLGDKLK
jgi:hypothetical protein